MLSFLARRVRLMSVLAFAFSLALGLVCAFSWERASLRGRVPRGVEYAGVALSGAVPAQVARLLAAEKAATESHAVVLSFNEEKLKTTAGALGISLDTKQLGEHALNCGRGAGVLREFQFYLARIWSRKSIPARFAIDTSKLQEELKPWTQSFLQEPAPPRIYFRGRLQGERPQPLRALDLSTLTVQLRAQLKTPEPVQLTLPVVEKPAPVSEQQYEAAWQQAESLVREAIVVVDASGERLASLSPRTLGAALGSELSEAKHEISLKLDPAVLEAALKPAIEGVETLVVEAGFEVDARGRVSVTPSSPGLAVDQQKLARQLLEPEVLEKRRVQLPLVSVAPQLSTEKAEALGIKGLVASFTTSHACCQPRVENIHTAARKMNGHIISPGERFSLNEFLGPRIGNSAYKKAPTIVHGKMKKTSGGGISQFATTLFNAVLNGGYAIIQRQPHSFYFPRYPEGHEATISYPEPDLIFQNDSQAGLLVKTQFSGTFIRVSLYGDNGGRKVTRHKSKRFDLVKAETEYEADPDMDPEKTKRLRAGQDGWTINVSRVIKFPDGSERKEQRDVVYNQRPQLLRVHPCMIPKGAKGHTGEECPEPEREEREEELSEDEYYDTVPVFDEEDGD